MSIFKGASILITGGTGSFGRAFAKHVLQNYDPKKVIIFSRDEWKQWEMRLSEPIFDDDRIRYYLGDIRDKERLVRSFQDVDYIIHAAALKQVPAAEYNPAEFVKTNVLGAMNIIDAAIDCGVKKVIALSTDKAVSPINLYGATKLCSDKLFVSGNSYVGEKKFPTFAVIRYGNVLGSRGSILAHWNKMLERGQNILPITDMRMTRFWITIDQAVEFVIQSFSIMTGGEIFIPKIPSMKIVDLAKAVAPDAELKICGIREGEKLSEMLINSEESRNGYEFANYYVIAPQLVKKGHLFISDVFKEKGGVPLPDRFIFSSDKNKLWLDEEDLKELLKDLNLAQLALT